MMLDSIVEGWVEGWNNKHTVNNKREDPVQFF